MDNAPKRELTLFDSTCMIVGIIVGVGIYVTAPTVSGSMGSWHGTLIIWLAGGVLALCGALCYAELASAYPQHGGEYVYLSRAYGRWAGFLFGWSQMSIIRPGDIALMAFAFAEYAGTLYAPLQNNGPLCAASAVVILTAINILGVKQGKWTQNVLTIVKAVGLLVIVGVGLVASAPAGPAPSAEGGGFTLGGVKLALILVMFTFGGWNDMGYIAAEVRHPHRNILRALLIGTVAVTALYLLVNGAFLHALGHAKMSASGAVAVDTVATVFPTIGVKLVAILICISALGALNGVIFTGSRVSYAVGTDHAAFRKLGTWSGRFGTPVWALAIQGMLSLGIVVLAGSFVDTLIYTAPVVWLFFLGTGISVFVLRRRQPETERPYRVSAYPFTPIVFCASAVFMLYSCVTYALSVKPIGLLIALGFVVAGAILYGLTRKRAK